MQKSLCIPKKSSTFARKFKRTSFRLPMSDGTNIVTIPALVDLHVHFREPGFSYKETIRTGSMAAQAAGYSDVFTMPNLNPVPDTVEHLQEQLAIIERCA